jgi:hypothetical protein
MELPVSDEERSPSQIKRWTFDLNSKNDAFGEEVISRSNGVLARMDDRYLSLPYRYGYVGHNDATKPYDTAAGGNRAGRVTNTYKRFDLANPTAAESEFFVGPRRACRVRFRAAQRQHGGRRRLYRRYSEQLCRDGFGAAHRRRTAHGRGRRGRRETAVPAARRHARQLVLGRRSRGAIGGVRMSSERVTILDRREFIAQLAARLR